MNPGKAQSQTNHWQARLPWILGLALAAITFALYFPVRGFDFIWFDDQDYVFENKRVQRGFTPEAIQWAFTSGHAANWHPVTWLSHMLDCQLFGLDAGSHHLTNVTFHVANTLLLFLLMMRLTGQPWPGAVVAALFAWHPVHVESVAWVSERKDVLSTFFGFLTLIGYVGFHRTRKRAWFAASMVSFALGLMSKPMLVTLPCVMLLLDFWPMNRFKLVAAPMLARPGVVSKQLALLAWEKWPFFLMSVVSSIATVLAQRKDAIVSVETLGLLPRAVNALTSYVRYLGKLAWPSDLAVFYPFDSSQPPWKPAVALTCLVAITVMVARQWHKRPWLLTGWLWFAGMLVPVIGIVQVGRQSMADRYLYVPAVGIFMVVVWEIANIVRTRRIPGMLVACVAIPVVMACMVCTSIYLREWRNSVALFEHARKVTPDNAVLRENLGTAYFHEGDFPRAMEHYTQALRLDPRQQDVLYKLGHLFQTLGRLDDAAELYRKAIVVKSRDGRAHGNLGIILAIQNRHAEAIPHLQAATELIPDDPDMPFNLGLALMESRRWAEAMRHLEAALKLKPDWADPMEALAWLFATSPEASLRNGGRAVALASKACDLTRRNSPMPLATLGAAYAEAGQFERAVELTGEAMTLAKRQNQPDLVAEFDARLRAFQSGKPWRISVP